MPNPSYEGLGLITPHSAELTTLRVMLMYTFKSTPTVK